MVTEKQNNNKKHVFFCDLWVFYSGCRGHFGDVKLKCEKQRKTWERAQGKKCEIGINGTFSHQMLLQITFLSPVSSTEGVIFNSNLRWLVPLTVEYLACRPSGS